MLKHSKIWLLIGLMGLTGCSSEDFEEPVAEQGVPVTLASYVTGYEEANETYGANRANEAYGANGANGANGMTRGWVPPTGYSISEELAEKSISVFFTENPAAAGGYQEEFFFKHNGKWRVSKEDLAAKSYYLYGYIPHEEYIEASVSAPTGKTFADGAVLTLNGVNTVMAADPCVIIGAKNGKDDYKADPTDYSVTGLQRGDFEYEARTTGSSGTGGNYVYLLFDHIYSAMRFKMRVWKDYNALRTIKLKELSMQVFVGSTSTKKKMNVTITLTKTADGADPISSITFTGRGTEEGKGTFYTNEAGEELNTEYKTFQGHFMPEGVTKLLLTSRYDVYDKQGNLIRENCEATNALDFTKLFKGQTATMRGYRYTVNMTIQPTYLYMLSEPDLDNPTVKVE